MEHNSAHSILNQQTCCRLFAWSGFLSAGV